MAFADRYRVCQVAKLVQWLLAGNPEERPSAREVLRSEVLPPTVGDQHIADLLRSLPDKCATPAAHACLSAQLQPSLRAEPQARRMSCHPDCVCECAVQRRE